jgi:dephospho-CoA kinase
VYFGGLVIAEVQRRGLEVAEASERQVREELRANFGMHAVAVLAAKEIALLLASGHRTVIIDGIYSYAEHEYLRAEVGLRISSIAVHARREVREARLGVRSLRPLSPDQIRSRDLSEIRTLDKATPIVLADFHVVNDSTLELLQQSVDQLLDAIVSEQGAA